MEDDLKENEKWKTTSEKIKKGRRPQKKWEKKWRRPQKKWRRPKNKNIKKMKTT